MGALSKLVELLTPKSRQIIYGTWAAIFDPRDTSRFAWYCPVHPRACLQDLPRNLREAKAASEQHARSHPGFVVVHVTDGSPRR
jgi:hypothetical protein